MKKQFRFHLMGILFLVLFFPFRSFSQKQLNPAGFPVYVHVTGTDYFNFENGEFFKCRFNYTDGNTYVDDTPSLIQEGTYLFTSNIQQSIQSVEVSGCAIDYSTTIEYHFVTDYTHYDMGLIDVYGHWVEGVLIGGGGNIQF